MTGTGGYADVRTLPDQAAGEQADVQPIKDPTAYRRNRNHLFRTEELRKAELEGGEIRAFCGVLVHIRAAGAEAAQRVRPLRPGDINRRDCVTCVDIWTGSEVVRL